MYRAHVNPAMTINASIRYIIANASQSSRYPDRKYAPLTITPTDSITPVDSRRLRRPSNLPGIGGHRQSMAMDTARELNELMSRMTSVTPADIGIKPPITDTTIVVTATGMSITHARLWRLPFRNRKGSTSTHKKFWTATMVNDLKRFHSTGTGGPSFGPSGPKSWVATIARGPDAVRGTRHEYEQV